MDALSPKGSIFRAKATLETFTKTREGISNIAQGVFGAVRSGSITAGIGLIASLSSVAKIYAKIENRATTGSTILLPKSSRHHRPGEDSNDGTRNRG
jgi:hypothetical protein